MDGFIPTTGDTAQNKQIVFSVKAGHSSVTHVRDLRGDLHREKANGCISHDKRFDPIYAGRGGIDGILQIRHRNI
jgi:hypothetical protein